MTEEDMNKETNEEKLEELDTSEDLTAEEHTELVDDKLEALVDLLVKKNLITREEFDEAYDDLFEDEDDDTEESEETQE